MNLKTLHDNILSRERERKYEEQNDDVKSQIDILRKSKLKEYQLKVIKREKRKPEEGDVFVFAPREDVYFYGKVLKANIMHNNGPDSMMTGSNVVFLFRCKSSSIDMQSYKPNYDELLIRPSIVPDLYWKRGYFYTITNEGISEEEANLDFGFYDITEDEFNDERGNKLDHKPKYFGIDAIATEKGIAYKINFELIINPSLLEF